jgi:hypothetical protein
VRYRENPRKMEQRMGRQMVCDGFAMTVFDWRWPILSRRALPSRLYALLSFHIVFAAVPSRRLHGLAERSLNGYTIGHVHLDFFAITRVAVRCRLEKELAIILVKLPLEECDRDK